MQTITLLKGNKGGTAAMGVGRPNPTSPPPPARPSPHPILLVPPPCLPAAILSLPHPWIQRYTRAKGVACKPWSDEREMRL